jgi:hypothetical protein
VLASKILVLGLVTMGTGALLFIPAASVPSYPLFLTALIVLKRDDIWPNRKGDSRIGGFLIQPAGWEEAGMDGKTLFYGPA